MCIGSVLGGRGPLCVLGMHRSGTSCLTGCLQQAGLQLGEVITAAPFNKKGNRERVTIQVLNDDVLRYSGGAWDHPPDELRWTAEHESRRDAIVKEFDEDDAWGFKDPRTLLTLPFWITGVPGLRFVGTFRHPLAVAKSLDARPGMRVAREAALDLWVAYNRRLLQLWETTPFPLVCFDLPPLEYTRSLRALVEELGLRRPGDKPLQLDFFDPALRHEKVEEGERISGAAAHLYDRILRRFQGRGSALRPVSA